MTHPTTGAASPGNGDLRLFNSTGGPTGTPIGTGESESSLKFGNTQAGGWSLSQPLVLQLTVQGGDDPAVPSLQQLRLKVHDPQGTATIISDKETILGNANSANDWKIRFALAADWIHPNDLITSRIDNGQAILDNSGRCTAWADLPFGNSAGTLLDDLILGKVGNDGTAHLLARHSVSTSVWYLNWYLHLAVKPRSEAISGSHSQWGFRINYVNPGVAY